MLVDYKSRHGILKVESAHLHISNHPDGPGRNGIFEMGLTNWPRGQFGPTPAFGKKILLGSREAIHSTVARGYFPFDGKFEEVQERSSDHRLGIHQPFTEKPCSPLCLLIANHPPLSDTCAYSIAIRCAQLSSWV